MTKSHPPVICAECGGTAENVGGAKIYPHRPDLHVKRFWLCACGAYCGCHGQTKKPLGTPAGPELRKARNAAHKTFDALWERKMARDNCTKHEARNAAYAWLSEKMGTSKKKTHIAMYSIEQCQRVVELCAPFQAGAQR